MAYFTISYTALSITISVWNISRGNRIRFFVRREPGTSAVIDQEYTSSGSSLTKTFPGLDASTSYAVNAGIVSGISTSWIGTQYFTTPDYGGGGGGEDPDPGPDPPEPTRPSDWYWWNPIYQNGPIQIFANEWNAFCETINKFRDYKGLSNYRFSYVSSGTTISASIVNEAVDAISDMNRWDVPSRAVSGATTITAQFFLDLQRALNYIR